MKNSEIVYVDKIKVSCEGEGSVTGHPLIYLDLSKDGEAVCPYCSKKFKLKK